MAMDIFENTFIWSAAKSCTMESGINNYLIPSCLSNVKKILKMAISGLKMAILNFEMAMDISENTFIWSAAKICTMESGIIHFDMLFNTFLSLKCQKGPKMAILGLKWPWIFSKIFSSDRQRKVVLWCLESSILALVFYGYQANPSLCITISPPFVGGG